MKDYHFQENDQDFGLTVRLDDINEKVKQRKSELNDLQELQAIDSENFKRIEELNDEIEYINIHLEELENDTCI